MLQIIYVLCFYFVTCAESTCDAMTGQCGVPIKIKLDLKPREKIVYHLDQMTIQYNFPLCSTQHLRSSYFVFTIEPMFAINVTFFPDIDYRNFHFEEQIFCDGITIQNLAWNDNDLIVTGVEKKYIFIFVMFYTGMAIGIGIIIFISIYICKKYHTCGHHRPEAERLI
jgi:hypothetical protein